jgi:hypothetical protein
MEPLDNRPGIINTIQTNIYYFLKKLERSIEGEPTEEHWRKVKMEIKRLCMERVKPPYSYKGTIVLKNKKINIDETVLKYSL